MNLPELAQLPVEVLYSLYGMSTLMSAIYLGKGIKKAYRFIRPIHTLSTFGNKLMESLQKGSWRVVDVNDPDSRKLTKAAVALSSNDAELSLTMGRRGRVNLWACYDSFYSDERYGTSLNEYLTDSDRKLLAKQFNLKLADLKEQHKQLLADELIKPEAQPTGLVNPLAAGISMVINAALQKSPSQSVSAPAAPVTYSCPCSSCSPKKANTNGDMFSAPGAQDVSPWASWTSLAKVEEKKVEIFGAPNPPNWLACRKG